MTKLEFANKAFFQWVFVRLTRCQQKVITEFKMHEISITPNGYKPGGKVEYRTEQWYSLQGWIIPLTGWRNDFKFIGKQWFIKITKARTL
jgi:hypothetical protein